MLDARLNERLKKVEDSQVDLQRLVDVLNDHIDRITDLENKVRNLQEHRNEPDSMPGSLDTFRFI